MNSTRPLRHFGFFVLSFALLYITTPNMAVAEPTPPPMLQGFVKEKGVTLHDMGMRYGLQGWAIEMNGRVQYAYTSPEGGVVFGILFTPEGDPETPNQVRALQGKLEDVVPGAENQKKADDVLSRAEENRKANEAATNKNDKGKDRAEQFFTDIEKSHWFAMGDNSAPYIYILMNPTCGHCIEYWKQLKPSVDDGNLQVRIIPFGRAEENKISSAALLSNISPAEAWQLFTTGNGHVVTEDKVVEGTYDKVAENTALWINWKLPTPPFTVYRSPADGKVKVISGQPDNILLLLSEFIQ